MSGPPARGPVPGFAPSAGCYGLAQQALERLAFVLAAAGAGAPEAVDLWTAILTGLVTQQVSNDPGGDRWARLVDPAIKVFLATQAGRERLTRRRAAPPPDRRRAG